MRELEDAVADGIDGEARAAGASMRALRTSSGIALASIRFLRFISARKIPASLSRNPSIDKSPLRNMMSSNMARAICPIGSV